MSCTTRTTCCRAAGSPGSIHSQEPTLCVAPGNWRLMCEATRGVDAMDAARKGLIHAWIATPCRLPSSMKVSKGSYPGFPPCVPVKNRLQGSMREA